MPLLHEPLCPVCGHALPLRALWKFARLEQSKVPLFGFLNTHTGLLSKGVGIACPACLTKFKVVQTRIRIVRALSWVLFFACAFLFGASDRRLPFALDRRVILGASFVAPAAMFWLQSFLTPYLAQV